MSLYMYDIGTIDNFRGMTNFYDYLRIQLIKHTEESFQETQSVLNFFRKAFFSLKCHECYWDGDIRGHEIYISAVPIGLDEDDTAMIVCLKQDDNGSCFLVSEIDLGLQYDSDKIINKEKMIKYSQVSKYQDEANELANKLYNNIMLSLKKQIKYVTGDDNFEMSKEQYEFEKIG